MFKTAEIDRWSEKKREGERERKSQREGIEKEGEGEIEKVRDRHDRKRWEETKRSRASDG